MKVRLNIRPILFYLKRSEDQQQLNALTSGRLGECPDLLNDDHFLLQQIVP